ncbi:MAG: flagellin [Rickettsiales bacterium]|nr:flagellin [Rickettsiales bacterium]
MRKKIETTIDQLSSGNRLTSAQVDVASLSISSTLRNQIESTRSVQTNVAQASSLFQVAEGGLSNIQDILLRMTAISTQANSDGITGNERIYLDTEFQNLKQEIERIAQTTNFNGVEVLNGYRYQNETQIITGDNTNETIFGSELSETITGFGGDDTILAGAGDDLIMSGANTIPGLTGSLYRNPGAITSLAQAEAIVAGGQPLSGSFIATALDYPNGAINSHNNTVANFLGVDTASLGDPVLAASITNRMVFVFDGQIDVAAAGIYNFSVGSDDGFNLSIDGTTVTERTTNRGFAFSNGNVNLTAGLHDIRVLYWENGGGEGLEVVSSLTGGGIVTSAVLSTSGAGGLDGNDTIDGGAGTDIVSFDGARADYSISQNYKGDYIVTDNRAGSPNGTDVLSNVEQLQFSDGGFILGSALAGTETLSFDISGVGSEVLEYDIVDATLDSLFTIPGDIRVRTRAEASFAITELQTATRAVTAMRAYVGSLAERSDYITNNAAQLIQNQSDAKAVLSDTDIAATSTTFASLQVQNSAAIAVAAQTNQLQSDILLELLNEGTIISPSGG